ncbi:uncharacterized protein [Palaemon carinicauda]|uniref:uncharacterized protein n=1 Tax=Palaemon carinicauda TaxID=392227 RepID=UPI0035B58E5D
MEGDILTKRGRNKVIHEGYLFIFDATSKSDSELKFWRCEQKDRCKVRLHMKDGKVIRKLNQHTHEPSAAKVEVEKFKTCIKRKCAETLEPPTVVVNECLTGDSQSALAVAPGLSAMRKVIARKQKLLNKAPPNPTNLEQLVIPESYTLYVPQLGVEEKFLLGDTIEGNNRILVFWRISWLQRLVFSEIWFADGTFTIAPSLFYQVYIISAKKHDGVIPIVYALLPNKQRSTYFRLFELLKTIEPNLRPVSIIWDFEQAAIHAFKDAFPTVEIKGCFFHLAQNMHRHLVSLGLSNLYKNDSDFALWAKMIIALAFVPLEKMDE